MAEEGINFNNPEYVEGGYDITDYLPLVRPLIIQNEIFNDSNYCESLRGQLRVSELYIITPFKIFLD